VGLLFVISLLIGLVMLVIGAEMLVRGGGQLALALRVPALVVGLTIVAFGTSTPELCVSLAAAFRASTDMALANVNGSNIANIALVLGAAALVSPLKVERTLIWREVPVCIVLQLAVAVACLGRGVSQLEGLILLIMGVAYNGWILREAMRGRGPRPDDVEELEKKQLFAYLAMLVVGLVILVIGAGLFVDGAVKFAGKLGMSPRYVGVTVVALGTSAPEVVTAVVSAYRGQVELAVGNSLGSNILNISMVLGITAMIKPIEMTDPSAWMDIWVAFFATLVMAVVVIRGRLSRFDGVILIAGYLLYIFLAGQPGVG
jgi:cation:H+ antiporter